MPRHYADFLNALRERLAGALAPCVHGLRGYRGQTTAGFGLGMMPGRAGGIVSTYFGGYLLGAAPATSAPFFIVLMLGVVCMFVGIRLVDKHLVAGTVRAH